MRTRVIVRLMRFHYRNPKDGLCFVLLLAFAAYYLRQLAHTPGQQLPDNVPNNLSETLQTPTNMDSRCPLKVFARLGDVRYTHTYIRILVFSAVPLRSQRGADTVRVDTTFQQVPG